MELRPWQKEALESLREYIEDGMAVGAKTLIARTINPASGKHKYFLERVRVEYPDYNMHDSGLNWPAVCVYDEINHDDVALARESDLKFRARKVRGAMSKATTLVDIKQWLRQSIFTLNRIQRHPMLMTLDDWRAVSSTDVFYKAVYLRNRPQVTTFNQLLTIYWHNYYMDELQGSVPDHILSSLSQGQSVAAYELFNTLPRLTYVRYCIAKAIIHRGDDDANNAR